MASNPRSEGRWLRLHPASMAVNLLPKTWRMVRYQWPLLLALLYGSGSLLESLFSLWLLGVFFAIPTFDTLVHFLTLRYRVVDGRLQIRSGLINREVRDISPDRIQTIERVQNLFQKAVNLVEVRIETASGSDVEGLLSALEVRRADELIHTLDQLRGSVSPTETEPQGPIIQNDLRDLLWYGVTANRLGLIAIVSGLASESIQVFDPEEVTALGNVLGVYGGVAMLIALILGAWLMGLAFTIQRHYGNRLTESGAALVSEEGLFTRRRIELPIEKVQIVSTKRPLLRRLLDFGTVHIETASTRSGRDGTELAKAIIPVVRTEQLPLICRHAIPGFTLTFDDIEWKPAHPKAVQRAMLQSATWGFIFGVSAFPLFGAAALMIWLVWPMFLWFLWKDFQFQGWFVDDNVILARRGFLNRRIHLVSRSKIQSIDVEQGPIMRRWSLASVHLNVAGNLVVMPDLSLGDALDLQQDLLPQRTLKPSLTHSLQQDLATDIADDARRPRIEGDLHALNTLEQS